MPTTRRSRTIGATPEQLWRTVCDPHHLPRWWPRVQRVEAVDAERFTEVLSTDKGRSVRADFRVLESRAPEVRRFPQEVEDSPFERLLRSAETAIRPAPGGAGGTRGGGETRSPRSGGRGRGRGAGGRRPRSASGGGAWARSAASWSAARRAGWPTRRWRASPACMDTDRSAGDDRAHGARLLAPQRSA